MICPLNDNSVFHHYKRSPLFCLHCIQPLSSQQKVTQTMFNMRFLLGSLAALLMMQAAYAAPMGDKVRELLRQVQLAKEIAKANEYVTAQMDEKAQKQWGWGLAPPLATQDDSMTDDGMADEQFDLGGLVNSGYGLYKSFVPLATKQDGGMADEQFDLNSFLSNGYGLYKSIAPTTKQDDGMADGQFDLGGLVNSGYGLYKSFVPLATKQDDGMADEQFDLNGFLNSGYGIYKSIAPTTKQDNGMADEQHRLGNVFRKGYQIYRGLRPRPHPREQDALALLQNALEHKADEQKFKFGKAFKRGKHLLGKGLKYANKGHDLYRSVTG